MSAALSRRVTLRAAAASALGLAVGVGAARAGATHPADVRLAELAAAYDTLERACDAHVVAHRGRQTDVSEAEFDALCDAFRPIEDELAEIPAATMAGVMAKTRATQVRSLRDTDGSGVLLSLVDHLVRLRAAGMLT